MPLQPRRLSGFALGLAGIAGAGTSLAAPGAGPDTGTRPETRVHVRGSARVDAHVARAAGRLVLSGTIADDAARPIGRARVALTLDRQASGPVPFAGASPAPCGEGGARPILEGANVLVLPTDDAARFCVRLALPTDRYVAHLEARTSDLAGGMVDGAKIDVSIDLALQPVSLRFDPERLVLSLDDESTALEVIASAEDDGVTTAAAGLRLALTNEAGDALGTASTDAAGHARFVVAGDKLGAPGPGELRVSFAGNSEAGATAHTMPVERRTRVDLGAPEAPGGRLPGGSPEDGVVVAVVATPRCAARAPGREGCRGLPTGTVEVRTREGAIVGAASLERGSARVVATFPLPVPMPADAEVPLRARYVPDAPWYQPGADLVLAQPVRAPSPWTRLPLILAGVAAMAWLVLARFAPGFQSAAARKSASHRAAPPDRPQAQVAVVQAVRPDGGWTGRVADAHDANAVPMARVAVERRGFERIETVAETITDAAGAFELPALDTRPGDELVAEGPLHAPLRRPLPPPGELAVQLVLRKRALIERLVVWARGRGKPYDARPEPTPGHVRRVATGDIAVVRWADAVERAAFGEGVIDRRAQEEVDGLAPASAAHGAGIAEEVSPDRPRPPRKTPERPRR